MCFGSKKEKNDEPAPRPVSLDKVSKPEENYNPPQQQTSASFLGHISEPQYHYPPPEPPAYRASNPQHDWQVAVPDTSLFPPPPAIFSGYERSPATNASEEEAEAGEEWCEEYPLTSPLVLDETGKGALYFNNIRLMEPAGFKGELKWLGSGHWQIETAKKTPDRCLISYPPLYVVNEHDPNRLGQPKTIYYEIKLHANSPKLSIGMGFTALPYPSFRMPGWHRGSLAVHGDDGHKYINDRWGGKDFTEPFKKGETYGMGMTLKSHQGDKLLVDIFFTRNGVLAGGWNVHEETDATEDLPVTGLEGYHDLCASVGTYDGVRFEAIFDPAKWLYKDLS